MKNQTAEIINQTLTMRMVADRYGIPVNSAGFSRCPFHDEDTPSLKIYDEIGRGFYCFGCNKGGDVIKFVMLLFGLSFPQALVRLKTDFSIMGCTDAHEANEWQRRQRVIEMERLKREREEDIQFIADAKEANRLRLEIIQNEDDIREWDPARMGILSPIWVDAINRRESLNQRMKEVMGID